MDHPPLDPEEQMPQDPQDYKTSDMALATYLRLVDFDPAEVCVSGDGTCYWHYRNVSDGFATHVLRFAQDEASVNPREFARQFAATKREFYNARRAG